MTPLDARIADCHEMWLHARTDEDRDAYAAELLGLTDARAGRPCRPEQCPTYQHRYAIGYRDALDIQRIMMREESAR
ncbi:hypothetical protein [Candidatus Nitrospira bockiana]